MTPCPDCGKPLYPDSIHTCSPQMTTIDNIMALVADNFQATTYGATDALRTAIEWINQRLTFMRGEEGKQ